MKKIAAIINVFFLSSFLFAQDIVFKNQKNQAVLDYLDTVLSINKKTIKVFIGPDHKQTQNTIFFNKPIAINNSQITAFRVKGSFLQHLTIDSSQFIEESIFIDSTAFDTLFVSQSFFKKNLIFRNVQIQHLRLSGGQLPENIVFLNCEIAEVAMSFSHFNSLSFINCTLGDMNFEGSTFAHTFNLTSNILKGSIRFDECTFTNVLHLASLRMAPEASFKFIGTTMPDTLDFSNNLALSDTVDLSKVRLDVFNKKCKLLVNGSDLSKLRLDYSYFKLTFPREFSTDEKENIYEGLLQNFKASGYQQSYKALDIEYKRFHAKQGTFGLLWWIPDIWWQYGYDRGRIFTITFWAVFLLTGINYFLINGMVSNVYAVANIPAYYRKWSWSRLWFSFVYTCVVFFSLSLKIDKIKFQHKSGTLYLMIMYVFGVICLAYIANYIIKV